MSLGDKIVCYQKQHDLSEMELSMLLNLSNKNVSLMKKGTLIPSIRTLSRISEILQIPVAELLDEDEELPLPFEYAKPKNKLPIIVISIFPGLCLFTAPFAPSWKSGSVQILLGLFIWGLSVAFGFYDFRRYYTFFTVDSAGITIYDESRKLPLPFDFILSLFTSVA